MRSSLVKLWQKTHCPHLYGGRVKWRQYICPKYQYPGITSWKTVFFKQEWNLACIVLVMSDCVQSLQKSLDLEKLRRWIHWTWNSKVLLIPKTLMEHNWNICHIFLGNAIQNNVCARMYVIPIILKREWMVTAQLKKRM